MMRFWLVVSLVLAVCGGVVAGQSYTYVDLVNMMTDMERLSVLPVEGETCVQWSSWDRASRYDEATGKYVNWDANGDNAGMIRAEGNGWVMAEMEGPGCIWRIWSAHADKGHVKIYLDGAEVPAVDLPFIGYFDRSNPPFTYPSLVYDASSGKNCYVPIPFAKSCKIVADPGWGAYYHFTYSTFPKGTTVPTFTRNLSGAERVALRRTDYFLRNRLGSDPAGRRTGELDIADPVKLAPGAKTTVAALRGERAITYIGVTGDLEQYGMETWRNVILKIYWDGEKNPSVWVPLGDFFGSGPGLNKYDSLVSGVTDDQLYSYWYMPFARQAVVELVNEGGEEFAANIELSHAPISRPVSELGRFHAKWHRDAFLPSEPERWIDWTMLMTQGRGRYCGVALEVWNPKGSWWGEGDEKFFVDGEKFPSTFGTGSEDYFGYAWCNPKLFQAAFHNQPLNEGNAGHVNNSRWHIADNIPFQKSFEGAIEKYYSNERPTLYAATAYWYLEPGGKDPYVPVPVSDRIFYERPEAYSVKGAIEGEKMKVLSRTGGDIQTQYLLDHNGKWSMDTHLWWTNAKPGDKLSLALPVENDGTYELKAQLTKAADYGIVRLYLNDQPMGEPVDLYGQGVTTTGELSFGKHQLTKGEHTLMVEILGANDNALKGYMVGLDYVRLAPAN